MHSDLSTNSVRVIGIEFSSRERKDIGHQAKMLGREQAILAAREGRHVEAEREGN
jgi:hypothetical protein